MDPIGMDTPPGSEEILMSSKLPRNTSIFRPSEGWGFDAEDVYQMDPTEEKENEPAKGFKFDLSIRKAAYSENKTNNVAMTGVDPLVNSNLRQHRRRGTGYFIYSAAPRYHRSF